MELAEILKKIKNKEFAPLYLLHGDESYYLDMVAQKLEHETLEEAEKDFNLTVLYGGKDLTIQTVLDNVRRYPFMALRQVVIIKEAQSLKDIEKLDAYANKPQNETILVLVYKNGKLDSRKKLFNAIKKTGVIFESKTIYQNQVAAWIKTEVKNKNYNIYDDAAEMLAEYLGTDLQKISNEIGKLCILLPPATTISKIHIEQNIGISKEYNVFELQAALAAKDSYKTHLIINNLAANPKENPIVVMLASLYGFFTSLLILQQHRDKSQLAKVGILYLPNASQEEINSRGRALTWKLKDLEIALRNYNYDQSVRCLRALQTCDLHSKGIDTPTLSELDLLRDLVQKFLAP